MGFRQANRASEPHWFNAPVPSFGSLSSRLLIVGLAPGLRGANRTGRPFTGDYAGQLLYRTLAGYGFAAGSYEERVDDGLRLVDCRIANAVRCVPPLNKPLPSEIATCNRFLAATLVQMPHLRAVLALGRIAFAGVLAAIGAKAAHYKFGHGVSVQFDKRLKLFGSYHCSRYNTNTGRLTEPMFQSVFCQIKSYLETEGLPEQTIDA